MRQEYLYSEDQKDAQENPTKTASLLSWIMLIAVAFVFFWVALLVFVILIHW